MADEAEIRTSLQIKTTNLEFRSHPASFTTDVVGEVGPTPGAFAVTVAGIDVDLDELTVPGLCRIANLDATNYVDVGIWDPETGVFYPLMELRPGEYWVFRLSRNLFGEYGTGAGTSGPNTNTLRIKANTDSCTVVVEAFES